MENKIVNLKEKDGKDILEFELDEIYSIDLNSEDQSSLRVLFGEMICEYIKTPFQLSLKLSEGYTKQLFIEISNEYINQLNKELLSIISTQPEETK
ncbi:MAG: hypothetical protein LKF83_06920 [Solobacterium sp.]|jgi:hypothetical protein|nr:hypothetical protein [Solobacterium sp.]